MADIQSASVYMGGADVAASAIESVLVDQISGVIDQVLAEGKITNAKAVSLKKRCAAVGAKVTSLVTGLHSDLIDEAKAAGIDVPPPSDGKTEIIAVINGTVSPLGGSR